MELLLDGAAANRHLADREFQQAIEIARGQSARLFELRATISLARLWASHGKQAMARDLLLPLYTWFTEGFAAPDLRDAKSLLSTIQPRITSAGSADLASCE